MIQQTTCTVQQYLHSEPGFQTIHKIIRVSISAGSKNQSVVEKPVKRHVKCNEYYFRGLHLHKDLPD